METNLKGLSDQEIIELLLSLVLPRQKCKRLAKDYIKHFKDLSGFLAASEQELERVGITPPCIFCIKLLHELPSEILKQKIIDKPIYESSSKIFDYLRYSMQDLKKEVFKAIYLDRRNQIIDAEDLFVGTLDSVPIHPREIVESAINHHAAAVIFAHNHSSGDPGPSKTDRKLTRDLVFVGMVVQIRVLDHIIIGGNTYHSFADDDVLKNVKMNS
ncbi:DNA repair protein RadC [Chloroflexota bacterium]